MRHSRPLCPWCGPLTFRSPNYLESEPVTTVVERNAPAKSEDLELAGLLLNTLRVIKMATAANREHSHVSANRAGVMWQLRERAMRSGDLAQRCAMTAPALTELVDSLTRDGLVRRLVAELNGLDYFAWVATAYLVTSTVLTPIAGKLGDLFGRKPFLLAGMIGFVIASALCGQSQNMTELIAFRALQGIFGGVLFASVFATIGDLYSPAQRARLQGVFAEIGRA